MTKCHLRDILSSVVTICHLEEIGSRRKKDVFSNERNAVCEITLWSDHRHYVFDRVRRFHAVRTGEWTCRRIQKSHR